MINTVECIFLPYFVILATLCGDNICGVMMSGHWSAICTSHARLSQMDFVIKECTMFVSCCHKVP